jgi:uncharacterized protein (TIGR00730 family)
MKTVTIFGSALPPEHSLVYGEARRLGRLLAQAGFTVCNGGYSGVMEASARGAREAGGHTIGVTCQIWPQPPNPWIAEEVRTRSFPERLMTLIERGDAYLVLPGGTGTLAELAVAWEIMNKARPAGTPKPLLVWQPYWRPVLQCLEQERTLLGPDSAGPSTAMDLITPVAGADEAARHLEAIFAKEKIPS